MLAKLVGFQTDQTVNLARKVRGASSTKSLDFKRKDHSIRFDYSINRMERFSVGHCCPVLFAETGSIIVGSGAYDP